MEYRVPYFDLPAQLRALRAEIDAAIAATIDRCSFCLGPDVAAFEQEFASFCGAPHAVGFNSGTSALHIALQLAGIGEGDEVITTPFTFVATSWAISYLRAKPVYVDVEPDTLNLDPALVDAAVTARTRLLLPVHLYGHPCRLPELQAAAARLEIPLIEDAAQAHGARYAAAHVGTFGQSACFSFYPGKNLGACGEAGLLLTRDPDLATRARVLRDHGSSRRYFHDEIGYNYRMEGLQAAVLRVKLKRLAAWTAARRRIAARYLEELRATPLRLPVELPGYECSWHLFVVRHPQREALRAHLKARGIGTGMHYPRPLHLQECYRHLGYKAGDFPVAEQAAAECLSLPIYPELDEAQIRIVVDAIREFFGQSAP